MFKRSFFCLCVFFIASVLIINSAFALSIGFVESDQTLIQGESATVDIVIELSDYDGLLSGYNLSIEYDSTILFNNKDNNSFNKELGDADSTVEVNLSGDFGIIDLSWFVDIDTININSETQPEPFVLATLNFETIGEGRSGLMFYSMSLYDELGDIFADITHIDEITTPGSITVSPIPEPATFILLAVFLVVFCFLKEKNLVTF